MTEVTPKYLLDFIARAMDNLRLMRQLSSLDEQKQSEVIVDGYALFDEWNEFKGQEEAPRWTREDVQRVLYTVVRAYEQANQVHYDKVDTAVSVHSGAKKKMPRRFILFGRRLPVLGGDSELLRDAIRIAVETLKDNDWWPDAT